MGVKTPRWESKTVGRIQNVERWESNGGGSSGRDDSMNRNATLDSGSDPQEYNRVAIRMRINPYGIS
jgi:hypothetical protein